MYKKVEPVILKTKNVENRYNTLIKIWSNTHIQNNFYLVTSKSLNIQNFEIFNNKNIAKYNYDVYIVLGSRVVGLRKVLFISSYKTQTTVFKNTNPDLTSNSTLIVEDYSVVGFVQLVFKPLEYLLRSLQPIDTLFDLQILTKKGCANTLIKQHFYSKLKRVYSVNVLPWTYKQLKYVVPNHYNRCNNFDEYFFSNFWYPKKTSPSLKFFKKINFTDFNSVYNSDLLINRKRSVGVMVSLYSSLVISNPVTRLFYNIWSLKNINNQFACATLKLKTIPIYKLILKFKKAYFYVTLLDSQNRIFFSLHTGMFLKFFNYKKSLKKSKSFKILLIRYLRKLLIVTGINNFNLVIRWTSNHLSKLLHILQKPIPHAFVDPLTRTTVLEQSIKLKQGAADPYRKTQPVFNFVYIVFVKTKPYGTMKTKKIGRIKRKIRRKVMKLNKISD